MKKYFAIIIMLMGINISFAQIKIPNGYTIVTDSPASGKTMGEVSLYFDTDKIKDTAVIVQSDENYEYALLIYLSSLNKTIHFSLGDRYGGEFSLYPVPLKIRKNVIEYCYFEDGTARFMHRVKLRYNPKKQKVQTIGYDTSERLNPETELQTSMNLLTGKYLIRLFDIEKQTTKEWARFDKRLQQPIFIENKTSFSLYETVFEKVVVPDVDKILQRPQL